MQRKRKERAGPKEGAGRGSQMEESMKMALRMLAFTLGTKPSYIIYG